MERGTGTRTPWAVRCRSSHDARSACLLRQQGLRSLLCCVPEPNSRRVQGRLGKHPNVCSAGGLCTSVCVGKQSTDTPPSPSFEKKEKVKKKRSLCSDGYGVVVGWLCLCA